MFVHHLVCDTDPSAEPVLHTSFTCSCTVQPPDTYTIGEQWLMVFMDQFLQFGKATLDTLEYALRMYVEPHRSAIRPDVKRAILGYQLTHTPLANGLRVDRHATWACRVFDTAETVMWFLHQGVCPDYLRSLFQVYRKRQLQWAAIMDQDNEHDALLVQTLVKFGHACPAFLPFTEPVHLARWKAWHSRRARTAWVGVMGRLQFAVLASRRHWGRRLNVTNNTHMKYMT